MKVTAVMPERSSIWSRRWPTRPPTGGSREPSAPAGRPAAVAPLIGASLRPGDVNSATARSTPATTSTPGPRTSTTATRTTTTRTTSSAPGLSADRSIPCHADFSFEDLVVAYFDCRRHKRNTASALAFEVRLERNLIDLHDELVAGAYRPGPTVCFVVTRPRVREVWAAGFRDRIVHHLLYNRIAPRFLRSFVADSCACIPGRGTLYAADRLAHQVRSITRNWSAPAFYLKCDLANFFVAIDKRILLEQLRKRVTEPWWSQLTEQVLMHDPRVEALYRSTARELLQVPSHKSLLTQPAHRGLPIGNLTSQFFANVYLDELDQHVKHQLRAPHYVRYVDDFILLHRSPQWLNDAKARIETLLHDRLAAALNPRKTILQPASRGIDFVGQVIRPWHRTIRGRTLANVTAHLRSVPREDLHAAATSTLGLLRQADSHHARSMIARLLLSRGMSVDHHFTRAYP